MNIALRSVSRTWGIRSLVTGDVHPFAASQTEAELIREGTGSPERYVVVHHDGSEWISSSGQRGAIGTARAGAPKRHRQGCSLPSDGTACHSGGPEFKDGD